MCFKELNNTWQTTSEIKINKNIVKLFMHHQEELIKRNRKRKEKLPLA